MTKTQYRQYLATDHWKELRKDVIATTDECARCKLPRWLAQIAYQQDLNAHHLTYARLGAELPEDLIPLCARCHELEEFGRSELLAPKEAHCEFCKQVHWNCRSPLCEFCLRLFGGDGGLAEWVKIFKRGLEKSQKLVARMELLANPGDR